MTGNIWIPITRGLLKLFGKSLPSWSLRICIGTGQPWNKPSLGQRYYILNLSCLFLWVQIFFNALYLNNVSPLDWILTIPCIFTQQMLHTKFGKGWPSYSWEENVNGEGTTDYTRRPTPTYSKLWITHKHLSSWIAEEYVYWRQYFRQLYFVFKLLCIQQVSCIHTCITP